MPKDKCLINKDSVLIIIPAKDEEMSIGTVIDNSINRGWKNILVVDDGSTDNTKQISEKHSAEVLSLCSNAGAWNAIQAGMSYALRYNYKYAVTIDADDQHEPSDIVDIVNRLFSYDIVIGSYIARGSIGKRFIWHCLRLLSGLKYKDLTSGFRGYSRKAMELLTGDDACLLEYQDVGVLLLSYKNGLKIDEIDVVMKNRRYGNSRVYKSYLEILKYLISTFFLIGVKRW